MSEWKGVDELPPIEKGFRSVSEFVYVRLCKVYKNVFDEKGGMK